jgi:hypothetical protein
MRTVGTRPGSGKTAPGAALRSVTVLENNPETDGIESIPPADDGPGCPAYADRSRAPRVEMGNCRAEARGLAIHDRFHPDDKITWRDVFVC